MNELLKWASENYGIITAGFTALVGCLSLFYKKVSHAIFTFSLSHNFRSLFGENPANTIKETCDTIKQANEILSIRQEIHEKYLCVGIYICESITGKTLWTNEYLNELYGLDSQEMLDHGWLKAVAYKQRDLVYKKWHDAYSTSYPYQSIYKIFNQRTGKEYIVETEAFPVMTDNSIVCYVGLVVIKKTENDKEKTGQTTEET